MCHQSTGASVPESCASHWLQTRNCKMRGFTLFLELNSSFQQFFSSLWARSWSNTQYICDFSTIHSPNWWLTFLCSGVLSILQQWVHKITTYAFWRTSIILPSLLQELVHIWQNLPQLLLLRTTKLCLVIWKFFYNSNKSWHLFILLYLYPFDRFTCRT